MKAWVIDKTTDITRVSTPLKQVEMPEPVPKEGELLIRVHACGICHTEIDEIEGRTPPPEYPVVPGHQVVGTVEALIGGETDIMPGDKVGAAWIYSSCRKCEYCLSGNENLCVDFLATGRDRHGGYAEYMTIPAGFAYKIPDVQKYPFDRANEALMDIKQRRIKGAKVLMVS